MTSGDWTVPIATFLLGQLSLLLVEWTRHWLTRRQRRNDARDEFQRQTLLELQDTLDVLARNAAMVFVLQDQFRLPGLRKYLRHDDPNAQAVLQASIRFTTLAERINDEEVRTLIEQLDDALRVAVVSDQVDETTESIELFRTLRRRANARIGVLLRSS